VSIDELRRACRQGRVSQSTKVWYAGLEAWSTVGADARAAAVLAEATPELAAKDAESRPPIADVPFHHTSVSRDGVAFVFDVPTGGWVTRDRYELLLQGSGKTDGLRENVPTVQDVVPQRRTALDEILSELATTQAKAEKRKHSETSASITGLTHEKAPATQVVEDVDPEVAAKRQKKKAYQQRKKLKQLAGVWLEKKNNPNVYVSGLPEDIKQAELEELFAKAGVFKVDPQSGENKVRIYHGEDEKPTGDALLSYAKVESVGLAIKFLHEYEIRPGTHICVQHAQFQEGAHGKMTKEELTKRAEQNLARRKERDQFMYAKREAARKLDWAEDEGVAKGTQRIVVLTRMFTVEEAEGVPDFYKDLAEEIRSEAAKLGEVEKVSPIENSTDGLVCVKFKDSASCTPCIELMRGRVFGGRTIDAYLYDGKTNLQARVATGQKKPQVVAKEVEEEEKRISQWNEWLEEQSSDDDIAPVQCEDSSEDD